MSLFFIFACGTEAVQKTVDVNEQTEQADETIVVTEAEVDSEENTGSEPVGRQLKRMSVAQVRDSMLRITGVAWGEADDSKWDEYSETLGVADYQLLLKSDRTPSVMFQKFLDDAATETCMNWIDLEGGGFFAAGSSEDTDRDNVRTIVRDLRWQVQGKSVDADPLIIDDYELLFQTVHQRTNDPISAWQSVCVALFTHPEFFMY